MDDFLTKLPLKQLRQWQYRLNVYNAEYIKIPKKDIIMELTRRGKKI